MCTSLVIYELTQDKLSIDIDQSLFNLVLKLINESSSNSNQDESAQLLSDVLNPTWSTSTKASRSSSGCSSMTSSPINSHHHAKEHHAHFDLDSASSTTNDDNEADDLVVYKKISAKCRKLFEKISTLFGTVASTVNLSSSPSSSVNQQAEVNFATSLLALDCLLNLNKNTRNLLYLNETYKGELRDSGVLDKVIGRIRFLDDFMQNSVGHHSDLFVYVIDRYQACLSFLQTVTQPPHVTPAANATNGQPNRKFLSICAAEMPTPQFVLNQGYLVEFKDGCLLDSLKRFVIS